MKTYLDCYPCFLRQALEAARLGGADQAGQHAALQQVMQVLSSARPTATPPEIALEVHRAVQAATGIADPYRAVKAASTHIRA